MKSNSWKVERSGGLNFRTSILTTDAMLLAYKTSLSFRNSCVKAYQHWLTRSGLLHDLPKTITQFTKGSTSFQFLRQWNDVKLKESNLPLFLFEYLDQLDITALIVNPRNRVSRWQFRTLSFTTLLGVRSGTSSMAFLDCFAKKHFLFVHGGWADLSLTSYAFGRQ